MTPGKLLNLTEGVLQNRALHQSESSISVRWVAENLCDPSLNHGVVDGSWGFGCAPAPLAGELRMTRPVPRPGAQLRAPGPPASTIPRPEPVGVGGELDTLASWNWITKMLAGVSVSNNAETARLLRESRLDFG